MVSKRKPAALVEKKVFYMGRWYTNELTEEAIQRLQANLPAAPMQNAKFKLTESGIVFAKKTLLFRGDEDFVPVERILEIMEMPNAYFVGYLLVLVRSLSPRSVYEILVFKCRLPQDTREVTEIYRRLKSFRGYNRGAADGSAAPPGYDTHGSRGIAVQNGTTDKPMYLVGGSERPFNRNNKSSSEIEDSDASGAYNTGNRRPARRRRGSSRRGETDTEATESYLADSELDRASMTESISAHQRIISDKVNYLAQEVNRLRDVFERQLNIDDSDDMSPVVYSRSAHSSRPGSPRVTQRREGDTLYVHRSRSRPRPGELRVQVPDYSSSTLDRRQYASSTAERRPRANTLDRNKATKIYEELRETERAIKALQPTLAASNRKLNFVSTDDLRRAPNDNSNVIADKIRYSRRPGGPQREVVHAKQGTIEREKWEVGSEVYVQQRRHGGGGGMAKAVSVQDFRQHFGPSQRAQSYTSLIYLPKTSRGRPGSTIL